MILPVSFIEILRLVSSRLPHSPGSPWSAPSSAFNKLMPLEVPRLTPAPTFLVGGLSETEGTGSEHRMVMSILLILRGRRVTHRSATHVWLSCTLGKLQRDPAGLRASFCNYLALSHPLSTDGATSTAPATEGAGRTNEKSVP